MDKKIFGLIAAVSGLGTFGAAQAATPSADADRIMAAQSFSELLEPIPNAVAVLRVVDQQGAASAPASFELAMEYHHHHHHHHGLISKFLGLHHHHHYHHHHYYHHHHHHHHHHNY
jgi:hypothetical protein